MKERRSVDEVARLMCEADRDLAKFMLGADVCGKA
ncbi:hypothetical protein Sinac_6441 [Singulisphaera acidiphila DSM 18658]|uniref:Uncharacterized protein n=1 Tax=Singulisphaera acidiphila (strain ATCC BAA-1392 / DSM 18658 / VKM B-2454 / MOB10) TaxID=886293 RepID=L0DNX2_SINAD|nr:hypothetical protein Sinac_6441 [Singulisphaera acidiphila DSM 18658]